jgi:hypothetical protein
MGKVQGLGIGRTTRISSRESAALPDFDGQDDVWRDVKHHPVGLVRTLISNPTGAEVRVYKLGYVPIEPRQTSRQILAQTLEYSADILIKSRFNYLGRPLVFFLKRFTPLRNLLAERGNFTCDLVKRTGTAVDVAKIVVELN